MQFQSGVALTEPTPEEQLADDIGSLHDDPLGYVMYNFPWETERSIQVVELAQGVDDFLTEADLVRKVAYRDRFPNCKYGPDLWACDFLDQFGEEIRKRKFNGRAPVEPVRFATVSGHEIGKSMLVALIIKFIMDTRPRSKGSVTAVTDEQLRTKTWAELGKWHHISLTSHWFHYSTGRGSMSLISADPKLAGQWRCDARTSRKEKSESFAGQHAPMATSFYIFDEASGIESPVFEVREGGLTSGEPMVFDFGNGTRNSGAFFENCRATGRIGKRYIQRAIDSRTVAITNKTKIAEDAEDRGEDSDYFRVRWRGMFPDASTVQFISTSLAREAGERETPIPAPGEPFVLGVDVAGTGPDDNVIWARRGKDARSFGPWVYRELDAVQMTDKVIQVFLYLEGLGYRPVMIFVDASGGYGGGVAAPLRHLGYPVTEVQFGGNPSDKVHYRFKMDEMWSLGREALKNGMAVPGIETDYGQRILDDLTQREFGYTKAGSKVALESKTDMKARGIASPDFADALFLTYAQEVAINIPGMTTASSQVRHEFDPYADDTPKRPVFDPNLPSRYAQRM